MQLKTRECYRCNLKALLLFLVVLGHVIERDIGINGVAALLYRAVYLFHMPLFVFLSGTGMRSGKRCFQSAGRTLGIYALAQTVVIGWTAWKGGAVERLLLTPYWHLWYLLSLTFWYVIVGALLLLWERLPSRAGNWGKAAAFLAALAVGLLCGFAPGIGRTLSLSRTLAFLPLVLAGSFWGEQILRFFSRRFNLLPAALAGSAVLYLLLREIPVSFLYQAVPYAAMGMPDGTGLLARLGCYAAAGCCSAVVLILCSRKKRAWTALGADTLWLYLLHPLVVKPLLRLPYPPRWAVLVGLVTAAALVALAVRLQTLGPQRYRFVNRLEQKKCTPR